MPTIEVDDVIYEWLQKVKKAEGVQGIKNGLPRLCDDNDAILHMYSAWQQMNKIRDIVRGL